MNIQFSEIQKILSKQFRKPESSITMNTRIKQDLGADSLSILELLLAMEDQYKITIDSSDSIKIKTVQDIVDYLEGLPDPEK